MEYAEFSWSRAISATISLLKHICPEAFETLLFVYVYIPDFLEEKTGWQKLSGVERLHGLKPEEH